MALDQEIQATDLEALRRSTDKLTAALERHVPLATPNNTTTQTTSIDTGSKALWFGLWVTTTCCLVMFVMNWKQAEQITDMQNRWLELSRKDEANTDRLAIILQWAPNLRDEVNREMEKRKTK
jgi:hypothetical protein